MLNTKPDYFVIILFSLQMKDLEKELLSLTNGSEKEIDELLLAYQNKVRDLEKRNF